MLSHLFGLARIYFFLLFPFHVACRLTGGIKQKTFVLGALISDHCRWLLFFSLSISSFLIIIRREIVFRISLLSSLFHPPFWVCCYTNYKRWPRRPQNRIIQLLTQSTLVVLMFSPLFFYNTWFLPGRCKKKKNKINVV